MTVFTKSLIASLHVRKPRDLDAALRHRSAHGDGRRRLLPGHRDARCAVRRSALCCRSHHRHLLPTDLPGAPAEARSGFFLSQRSRLPGGGVSTMFALSTGNGARAWCVARHRKHRISRACSDRRRRVGRIERRCSGFAIRHWRVSAPPTVSATPGSLADRSSADAAHPSGKTAHPRYPAADDTGRHGCRISQPSTVQRDLSAVAWASPERIAAIGSDRGPIQPVGCDPAYAVLSPAV